MQPSRNGALVDLVDRILIKGIILQADVIISVSGVPLIGINLKAAIAGMTTMVDYGMMETWDEKIRKSVLAESNEEAPLGESEKIILKTVGSCYCRDKVKSGVWRSGYLYITNKRLFLFRKKPNKVLFETSIDRIESLSFDTNENLEEKCRALRVLIKTNNSNSEVTLVRSIDVCVLKSILEEKTKEAEEKVLVSIT